MQCKKSVEAALSVQWLIAFDEAEWVQVIDFNFCTVSLRFREI